LPVLDTMPLSHSVGRWVIETACRQAADWSRMGRDIRVGINLSPTLFSTDDLPIVVANAIADAGCFPSSIELEVTENILFKDDEKAAAVLNKIRDSGVAIAFDDFGTGYASLTHLKRYPIDRLKIDQTFIRDMLSNKDDQAIVGTIVGLGKLLNMHLIAEGIEDRATADAVAAMGCEEAQGYYFGRPIPAAEFFETHLQGDTPSRQKADVKSATRPAAKAALVCSL
jgi:EAL domain-containing protein (putative c-di-GMP-specific phosphodiesterase class I)